MHTGRGVGKKRAGKIKLAQRLLELRFDITVGRAS